MFYSGLADTQCKFCLATSGLARSCAFRSRPHPNVDGVARHGLRRGLRLPATLPLANPPRPNGACPSVAPAPPTWPHNTPMPTTATPYPPGDPRREDLRAQLRTLEAETLHVAFVSRHGAYHLLSYRLEPVRRRLDEHATARAPHVQHDHDPPQPPAASVPRRQARSAAMAPGARSHRDRLLAAQAPRKGARASRACRAPALITPA